MFVRLWYSNTHCGITLYDIHGSGMYAGMLFLMVDSKDSLDTHLWAECDFLEREKEAEEEDEKRARELAHKEMEEMKRKELERLGEERQWKEEQERLAREAAAREAERKRLEEVRK